MSFSLTDDHIRWISNHPITRKNIKEQVEDLTKHITSKNVLDNYSKYEVTTYVNAKIRELKSSTEMNLEQKVNKLESSIEKLDWKITREINDAITNRIIRNSEFEHIYQENLNKLQSSLEEKGRNVMSTLINDPQYQYIAVSHLESLSKKLTNTCDAQLENIKKDTTKLMDIQKQQNDKQINEMKSELKYYKDKIESMESFITNGFMIVGMIGIGYILFNMIFSFSTNTHTQVEYVIKPIIEKSIENTMGSPILKIN